MYAVAGDLDDGIIFINDLDMWNERNYSIY